LQSLKKELILISCFIKLYHAIYHYEE